MRNRRMTGGVTEAIVRRHRPVYQIVLYMGLLLLLGLVVMYALGPQRASVLNYAYGFEYSDTYFFNKQLVSVVIAVVAFGFCAVVPYRLFTETYAKKIFLLGLGLCALLVIMGWLGMVEETNGAYRWFYIGGLGSFQPSELLKFGALVFLGGFLGMRAQQGKVNEVQETLVPLAMSVGLAMVVVVILQKDLGTGISLVAIVLSMLVVSGMSGKLLVKVLGALALASVLLIIVAPHRMERVMTFLGGDTHIEAGQEDPNYHITQARIAIGSGGLTGLGIGNSVQASGYLPEATTDSMFAVMGETFGFVGLVTILGLFTGLLFALLGVAARLPDMKLRLVVAGVFGWVGSHVILNVAAMTGVAPLTGIPLPLLSQGGSSIMFIAAALGLAFQLSRFTTHKPIMEGGGDGENIGSRRRVGRTRYARSGRL